MDIPKFIGSLNGRAYAWGLSMNKRYKTGEKIYSFRQNVVRVINIGSDLSVVLLSWTLTAYGFLTDQWGLVIIGLIPGMHGTACMFQFMRER